MSVTTRLLVRGPATRRGRLGAYLWDIRAAWTERLLPHHRLPLVVLRDALQGHR